MILLSYPKSGSTWLRYIIESLTPYVCVDGRDKNSIFEVLYNKHISFHQLQLMNKVVYCRHSITNVPKKLKDNNAKLILLLRDYDVLLHPGVVLKSLEDLSSNKVKAYAHIIRSFDNYNGPKLLITYEDLITDINHTTLNVLDFLYKVSYYKLYEFISKLGYHKKESLRLYVNKQRNNIFSYSEDLSFYKNSVPVEEFDILRDKVIKELGNKLFNKYFGEDE